MALLILLTRQADAATVTVFQDVMQPTTPASGWAYLWNSGGVIGNPANYTPLLATTHPELLYDADGVNGLPSPAPANFVYFGSKGGGHPGAGVSNTGSGGIERYAIASYTVGTPIQGGIGRSSLRNTAPTGSTDGLSLRVYLNNSPTPLVNTTTAAGFGKTTTFNTPLGELQVGDIIYVAVGARNLDYFDTFALEYDIVDAELGDANADGFVDGGDYTIWADHYLQSGQNWNAADFTGEGVVDGGDYTIWADNYSPPPALAIAVPEPSTLTLFGIAVFALLGYAVRRRFA